MTIPCLLRRAVCMLALGWLLALAGCATPQALALRHTSVAQSLVPQAEVPGVPFFAQKEYECGPAALAMALGAADVQVQPDELVAQVYLPARKGSLQVEMLAATRQRGLLPYTLAPRLDVLMQELAAGHPVLVFQNVSLPIYPMWHYAVAIGYDLERNTITLHSGETARMEMSLFTFERTWARGHYWAMLALKPDQLPATADAPGMARAIAPLEAQQPQAARTAYQTALARWPQHAQLQFGLGNTAYVLGDKVAAVAAYQAAVQQQPDFADAWNNLAQTQFDLGQLQSAKEAITQAVAQGGVRTAQYLQLQAEIAARAGP